MSRGKSILILLIILVNIPAILLLIINIIILLPLMGFLDNFLESDKVIFKKNK